MELFVAMQINKEEEDTGEGKRSLSTHITA